MILGEMELGRRAPRHVVTRGAPGRWRCFEGSSDKGVPPRPSVREGSLGTPRASTLRILVVR